MPIFRKPEETVRRVLERLRKTKEVAIESVTDDNSLKRNQLVSKFQEIEEHLKKMDGLLPQVKSIEEELIERFMTLEQKLDDDIFKDKQRFDEIVQKLQLIFNIIQSVEKLTSAKLQLNDTTNSNSSTKDLPSKDQIQRRMASEEWSKLITADTLLTSEAMQSLLNGFEELPTNSQLCLLSLSIFPESCVIKKKPIIYWWIAEDFLAANSHGLTAEEVGDRVFQELINRRLIRANKSPFMESFTVHPWIRRKLISLAKQAELFDFDDMGRPINNRQASFLSDNQESHHVHSGNGITDETSVTVFNISQKYLSFTGDWLSRLKKVVVLQLGRWQSSPKHHIEIENEESLKGLRSLRHLRYLSLRGVSRIFTLPRSLTQLVSLEILDLRACHNLEKLPSDISTLRNLTHLDVSECYLLESMPNGLEKLSKLQVLKGFVVGNSSKASCRISDLAGLTKLRKLGMYIGKKAEEEDFMKLEEIKSLLKLTISWGVVSSSLNAQAEKGSFRLPSNLRKLDLRCIPEDTLPEWVDLHNLSALEKLYIRGGQLESLRNVKSGRLSIRMLRLKYLKSLKVSKEELKKLFPDAVYLEAVQCQDDNDIFWSIEDDRQLSF